ncbi:hypothetical protein ROSINTL182_07950 [Roseburia intestinalis L1-82]|uniref:Uncharacterized protein n=1 Tax=Roseburia intestinalis L1-82 TaxID=536231 RepID=C7GDE9_9FIRM|nr:hypothetical protein ROSINTL182_07950 [Roseburia intestinalis L1-82]
MLRAFCQYSWQKESGWYRGIIRPWTNDSAFFVAETNPPQEIVSQK